MWFTERGTSKLGRVTTSGSITEVDAPPPQGSLLTDVTTGPDRALSFTRDGQVPPPTTIESFLSRYDIATGTFTQFAVGPSSNQAGVTSSGGRLWVAMRANDEVDAFTPDGAVIERISLNVEAGPQNVLRPANGDVWVTEPVGARLARVQHQPSAFEVRALPDGTSPQDITLGPDGNMWFTALGTNDVDKLTPGRADQLSRADAGRAAVRHRDWPRRCGWRSSRPDTAQHPVQDHEWPRRACVVQR